MANIVHVSAAAAEWLRSRGKPGDVIDALIAQTETPNEAARERGQAWPADEMLDFTPDTLRLLSQRAAEWNLPLEDTLVRLLTQPQAGVAVPIQQGPRYWSDGSLQCGCDGPEEAGSHHQRACHNYRPEATETPA